MMWWHLGGFHWGFMGIGLLWMVILWGAIIAFIVWGMRRLARHNTTNISTGNPLDIAKTRYARGEINKDQFEQIKKDLQS